MLRALSQNGHGFGRGREANSEWACGCGVHTARVNTCTEGMYECWRSHMRALPNEIGKTSERIGLHVPRSRSKSKCAK